MEGTFFSADGHVIEPPDLWTSRIEPRFRERAPRLESLPDGDYYFLNGRTSSPLMGLEGSMLNEKIEGHIDALRAHRFAEVRRGAWEPAARLADQDLDNLRAEVIYPGIGLGFFALGDAEFQRAIFRAYNDWLIDFCRFSPNRLLGAGLLTVKGPVEWAIEEAYRVAKGGMSSVSIPATLP